MNNHRIKRTCTKAASFLLAVLISVSSCSAVAMAEELSEAMQPESAAEYVSEDEGSLVEELVFEDTVSLEETETANNMEDKTSELLSEAEEIPAEETQETEAETTVPAETETALPAEHENVTEKKTESSAEEETESATETETETVAEEETTKEEEQEALTEVETETEIEEESSEPEKETEKTEETEEAADKYGLEDFNPASLAGIDFSSMRLIIATADDSIFVEDESIIGSFGNIYLLQFEDVETAMKAYTYYLDKVDIVDIDTGIQICEGEAAEDVATGTIMTEEENPLSELKQAMAEGSASYDVALIDTGAFGSNIAAAISMIGDDPSDNNGHGTKMAEYITAENDDVSILSIKALGSDGKGDISAVYAAIEYAISQNVKVINLSASAYASSGNLILRDAVRDAVNAGIIFVGSAGNNGKNAQYYVTGNIEEAFIIGAADENGVKLDISNFGETVDYNVAASSTSEAAARMSGWLSVHDISEIDEILNQDFVYAKDYKPTDDDNKEPEDQDEHFKADQTWPSQYSNSFAGITLNTSIEWSGMDAWWPDSNGLITRSAAWEAIGEVSSISSIKPGDVLVWAEGSYANWVNHIAIVTEVASDGSYFYTADGNLGNATGVGITKRTDFYKRNSTYGKVLVWRNTTNGAAIAKYVDLFTRKMISENDTSMAVQWSNINWCYCFVVAALLESEPVEEYGSLKVIKDISVPNGTIKISKITNGSAADKDEEFIFTLKVTNTSGSVVLTKFSYTKSDGTTGTISGNGGTVKLKNGQNVVITGIPQGYGYTVTENDNANYTTKASQNGGTATDTNTISGSIPAASSNQSFSFTINFKNGSDNVSSLTIADGLTTDSNGNVVFTLKPGTSGSASMTFSNIPEGYSYTVTEDEVSGWTSSPSDRTRSGTIVKDTTKEAKFTNTYTPVQQTAAFTNTRKTTTLTVSKTTSADSTVANELKGNSMYSQDFSGAEFSVKIYDANAKTWGNAKTYKTGTDGTFTISGLYVGNQVQVTEIKAPAGYLLPATVTQTITLAQSGNKMTFKDAPTFATEMPEVKKAVYAEGKINAEKSVAGAVFMMEYYDNTNCTGKAVRTWYFKTDSTGTIDYAKKYLASGYTSSDFYTDTAGNANLPLGSVQITEVEAPAGYKLCKDVLKAKIIQNSSDGKAEFSWITATGGQVSIAKDKVLTLGDEELVIVINKINAGTGKSLKGAVLQILDGKNVVYEWTTDGKAREIKETLFLNKTYTLHEKEAPEDYMLAEDIKFSIDGDGNIKVLTENVDTYETEAGFLAVKMEDVKMVMLPVTGSSDMMSFLMIGSLLALGGAGAAIVMSLRKRQGRTATMTKAMKRTVSAIVGVIAAAMFTVPTFAAGNIEVVSEVNDIHTYNVYQLLSGTKLEEDVFWDIHIAEDIPDTLWDELGADKHERAATEIAYWLAESIKADTTGSFAVKVAKAVLAEEQIGMDAKFTSGQEIELEDGFYLVTSDDAQPMLVLIGNGEKLTINEKSSVPKMEKEIGEVQINDIVVYGDAADTGIGKIVPYRIIGTLPSNYDAYDEYSYEFHDVFDPCLVVQKDSVKVIIEDAEGTKQADITKYADVKISDTTLDVCFKNLKQTYLRYSKDDTIVVYYEVMITDEAFIGTDSNDNYAWIEYTRSPTCDQLGKSEPDRCRLYTWELDLNKLATDTKEALKGAEFTIHDAKGRFVNTDGTLTEEQSQVSVWTTDANGHFAVPEVDSGTYTVTETKAPEGYQAVGAFNIMIEADYEDENNVTITASSTGNLAEIESVDAKTGITFVRVSDLPDNPPPKTGDNTNVILFAVLLAAGLLGLSTAILILIRKDERNREG